MVPVRVLGAAAGRADDEDPPGVGVVAEDGRVRLAGAGAGGGEQEQPGTLERSADLAGVGTEFGDELCGEVVQNFAAFLLGWLERMRYQ